MYIPTIAELLFFVLLTWRITVLITFDRGPADVLARFRSIMGVTYDEFSQRQATNWFAEMLNCHFCSSFWIGLAVALVWYKDWSFIIVGLALSAGSLIVDSIKPTL